MFLTAASIRRLIKELEPPLISYVDPNCNVNDPRNALTGDEALELFRLREELENRFIEGSCLDLTLETIEYQVTFDVPFLGRDNRIIPATKPVPLKKTDDGKNDIWRLFPNRSHKLQSLEYVNMPPWLMGILHNRTSVFRSNSDQSCTFIKPGFSGRITTEVHVMQGALDIQRGFPFVSLAFCVFTPAMALDFHQENMAPHVSLETDPYGLKHNWGSKITTDGKPIPS